MFSDATAAQVETTTFLFIKFERHFAIVLCTNRAVSSRDHDNNNDNNNNNNNNNNKNDRMQLRQQIG